MPLYIAGWSAAKIKEAVCKSTSPPAPRGAQARLGVLVQGRQAAARPRRCRPRDCGRRTRRRFTLLRPLLFTIAYEILGSATEADDVLQDSYLRWAAVDLAECATPRPTWPSW